MKNVWLIGSGNMAQEYIKVLKALNVNFTVIGRGGDSAKKCEEASGCKVIVGGLTNFLAENPAPCTHAIISVGVESLTHATCELINYGITKILVEKPGGLYVDQVQKLASNSKERGANIYVAYNRRFCASVLKAERIISQTSGVISINFEFTEWAHIIKNMHKSDQVLARWFLANSTHVVDLAFYLAGAPKKICSFTSGALDWHPAASVFCGAGVSKKGALFSYQANWESAGRWGVEILTNECRLILRPIERLQIQKRNSVTVESVECDYRLDEEFKPGLYLQTQDFLNEIDEKLCNIFNQLSMMRVYEKIAGY
ncbi:MAG: myo-inositol 2-dehydrogenase [Polynucleobacter sp. 39-45-136]|jgi:predicted dehydrogenase|nr:MAG: myo-inositol 2-dehydrogenase [Polynucleobacter sp. 39-45-136]